MTQVTESGTGRESEALASENAELRQRVAQLERELADVAGSADDAIAASQDRAYWLDRWHLDLNAVMERPGADRARALARALRGAVWRAKSMLRALRQR